ncbi:DUF2931 family protein [Flavobacterium sp. KACC 22763]|uniref:DUF2931 family protein n=1 Tax=Flavobacterium sp. KACC 22763 TaxID=3025668 RepID=UPI002366817B|nr:DUF2931 family protein [Flavobacterium sp. KACC 22763]WDF65472.1 DUF2931 family protein [Flavobacterium sp. KACC 22763]
MKINSLNKLYLLIAIVLSLLLLSRLGYDLWKEKEIPLTYYFLNTEKQKEMLTKIEKFEWLAETSADETCPVEVVYGSFILSDNTTAWIPSEQYLNDSWGASSSGTMVVGDDKKKVPERMQITWFSYAENKFFAGDFALPQKKMYDIFKKDYGTTMGMDGVEYKNEYNTLTVAFAPEGLVTLWIGGIGNKEIGTYQGHETFDIEWGDFSKNLDRKEVIKNYQKDMPLFVQEEIANNKISNTYFKNRLKRYNYKIGTNRKDFRIYDYDILFMNNEVISNTNTGLEFLTDTTNGKAVPISFVIFVQDQFSRQFEVRIWVDLLDGKTTHENDYLKNLEKRNFNNQLMERFKKFFDKNENVELYIKFNKEIIKSSIKKPVYSGKIYLKSPTSEVEIPNSKVEVYDAE